MLLGDWNFAVDADGKGVTNGQAIGSGNYTSANLADAAGAHRGMAFNGPRYATYTLPETIRPGMDGHALDVGPGYVFFANNPDLSTASDFSVWARFQLQSFDNDYNVILSRPGGFWIEWGLFIDPNMTLDFNFTGRDWSGGLFDPLRGTGPKVNLGQWYDVGVSFRRIGGDLDTVKLYFEGNLVGTFQGHGTFSDTDWLHIGSIGNATQLNDALFDRVAFWNGVLPDEGFRALSVPEPSSIASLAAAAGFMAWRWRSGRRTPSHAR